MFDRVYNFSAGPAMMPQPVLEEVQKEMQNYKSHGMSVMEMSHRSDVFLKIYEQTVQDLRTLIGIPEDYEVLFIQGGATLQFSMVPLNLMRHAKADYIVTGAWSDKACTEAKRFGDVASVDIPGIRPDTDYVYICENETIQGTTFQSLPMTHGRPLVSDQSSVFLTKRCDVRKYGLIFASTQKNVGPAGQAIVIIRKDLVPSAKDNIPAYLRYQNHAKHRSMYNTPNCWGIYICGKMFRYLSDMGGLEAVEKENRRKAALLYDYLDSSSLFHGTAPKEFRSLTNIPFTSGDENTDRQALHQLETAGLVNLKGHRSVGGLRASLYNAMPLEGVIKLVETLHKIEETLG